MTRIRIPIALLALTLLSGVPSAAGGDDILTTKITNDRPGGEACVDPNTLTPSAPDVNNMPQAEVWIDVAEDGRIAAAAKDYRYSPLGDTTYNNRVWNGLYLSGDGGRNWDNRSFEDATPLGGISGVTDGSFGQLRGQTLRLTHETDPVVAFDRDGTLFTSSLAYEPDGGREPSAIVVSRFDPDGQLVPGSTHYFGLENDARLFNDKNWIAVDRGSPAESTIVVNTWRLFTSGASAPAPEGGYITVSADGGRSYGAPIHLPMPPQEAALSQFYQPVIGPDPRSGRKTLWIVFRTRDATGIAFLNVLRAEVAGTEGDTDALHARLARTESWTSLPERVSALSFGSDGYDGSFRFSSFFQAAVDRGSGLLYAVVHALDPLTTTSWVYVTRSSDAGETWTPLAPVDPQERGNQLMPALAVHAGRVSVLWYDSRHDPDFVPLGPMRGIDVYYADLDAELGVLRTLRLTPETQPADRPVFTRARPASVDAEPHDHLRASVRAAAAGQAAACERQRYGFIGDYIGLAADTGFAYAAWCDLRDLLGDADVCAGHSCNGRRNQNIYFARIPRP